ncbi:hypothetical protein QLS31_10205 [Flavobacterium sp. XS2P24]|uniref:hypothetical protein n=1 Tax=Flavobacterium sp. XS2P24 TaxID=3041249 RepID=UPI0024A9D1FC|nr:hypothetical protein [Flavobacterium sp. XS2P24]MDI6050202.1 hypothetical protein [Flavobacterium sp. XS2P24]
MKNFRLQAAVIVLLISTAFVSCSDDDNTPNAVTKSSLVTKVEGAVTGDINVEVPLTVTFSVDNNCGSYNKFIETAAANTKTIEVESKYEGTDCGTTPTSKTVVYKFKSIAVGTYNLKFKKTATEFVTHTIVID